MMTIIDSLLPEFDREMATTRKMLERVPANHLTWKPHAKSMTLGRLASHLAEVPARITAMIGESSFNATGRPPASPGHTSPTEILALFDTNVAAARKAIATRTDAEILAPWTLRREGRDVFTMPKISVLRSFLLNHSIHHRGQLSVYLRLNDVPVPSIYGPSADEPGR